MLNLIADRLERQVCDDVLEVAWSTMWNVTDETPDNCRRFLENRGMEFFLGCLKVRDVRSQKLTFFFLTLVSTLSYFLCLIQLPAVVCPATLVCPA